MKILKIALLTLASVAALTGCHSSDQVTGCKVDPIKVVTSRQVVRGPEGASLVTYSTDANGTSWIDAINLTTKN